MCRKKKNRSVGPPTTPTARGRFAGLGVFAARGTAPRSENRNPRGARYDIALCGAQ